MSEIITTLHKKGDLSVDLYPNIKRDNIPDGAINNNKLANNSVRTAHIIDNAITTNKISNGAVTNAKIDNYSVSSSKLATDSVTTAKIMDRNVTSSKLDFALCHYKGYFTNSTNKYYFDMISTIRIPSPTIADIFHIMAEYYSGDGCPIVYVDTQFKTGLFSLANDNSVTFTTQSQSVLTLNLGDSSLDACTVSFIFDYI